MTLPLILYVWILAACIPARTPAQLAYTPGPAVRVIDGVYDAGTFRVAYPDGWRVVTSAASEPVSVLLVAPEGDALIMIGAGLTEAPPPAGYTRDLRSERREVRLDTGATVVAILNAPPVGWDSRLSIFEDVVNSLTAP